MTYYLVPLLSRVAHKLGILDNPDGKLKQQRTPVPYLGGVAIYIGFITALALVFPFENNVFLLLIGSTLLLFVGLIDDLVAMKPYQKLFGQIIATFCFLKGGFYLKEIFLSSHQAIWSSFWLIISAGWILSIINAFNLVDVMDGLATTLAIAASVSFFAIALLLDMQTLALLLAAFIGALCAFLWFNYPSAKMYLGDAGSLFIGGFLAAIPFMVPWGTYTAYGYYAPIAILAIPLLEVGTLILVRSYKRIPFYQGSPDHFSIYLQHNGWSKPIILGYVVFMSMVLTLAAIVFFFGILTMGYFVVSMLLFACLWYIIIFIKKPKK